MVSSTERQLETLNPPLIVVIWASNLFLERERERRLTLLQEAEGMHKKKKKTGMFEDGGMDVIEPLGDS